MPNPPSAPLASMARIGTHPDVYPPAEDSFLLVDTLADIWREELSARAAPPNLVIEIGTGSGYVACSNALLAAAHTGASSSRCVTRCSDINPQAVRVAEQTFAAHDVAEDAYAVSLGDLLEPHDDAIRANGGADILLFNPPYVVTDSSDVGSNGIEASWAGGTRGREVLDRLLPRVREALSPNGGMFLCVLVKQNDPEEVMEILMRDGLRCAIVARCRADEEELFVMRCDRRDES